MRVWLPNARRRAGEYLDELRFVHDAIPGAHGGFAARVAKRLEAMFRDGEDVSDIPILMEKLPPFTRRVAEECRRIPRGQVASYQDLAERAGSPAAMRAVGNAMASNRLALLIPCHRVVKADLSIGNYGGGAEMKRWLLEKEQG